MSSRAGGHLTNAKEMVGIGKGCKRQLGRKGTMHR